MHKKNQTANKKYALWHLCLPGILAVWVWFAPTAIADDADKKVYFGDLHLHTRYSYDAFYLTTDEGLDDAYRYAKGEAVPRGGNGTRQIKTPLDFLAVTEHSEFLGALQSFTDPEHPLFDHPQLGRLLRSPETDKRMKAWINLMTAARNGESLEGYDQVALKKAVWSEIVDAADRHYDPGSFTTFAAYEWTGYIGADNLHRNVIFEDTKDLDLPFSADDSNLPEDLWSYLEKAHERGVEAIAIPHNSNVSNGRMFTAFDTQGMPIDKHYAERRHHHEPVVEITQSKGSSETHPDLSPYDPFSNFEIFSNLLIGHGQIGKIEGSYAREALLLGIDTKKTRGFNPLMFGFIGSTDSHGAYSHTEEDNVTGFGGPDYDPTPESRWDRELWNGLPYYALSAGGVTGVWAEANTREQIFAAFKRRETYATSGPRIRVRAFAGWEYSPDLMDRSDWVELAYANGVPMGSVIDRQPEGEAPRLAVWAERDPKGANLDRIQIIKGSIKKGEPFIHIFNVALSDGRVVDQENQVAAVGNTVDVEHASYTNDIGAAELKAMWVDPDFDPDVPAFYYVRVIEIPTPRWSTYDAAALKLEIPEGMPAWIQERAFASPIWYEPPSP